MDRTGLENLARIKTCPYNKFFPLMLVSIKNLGPTCIDTYSITSLLHHIPCTWTLVYNDLNDQFHVKNSLLASLLPSASVMEVMSF